MGDKTCALCGSDRLITFHHLIPRSCHGNKWFRKRFARQDMRERGIAICRRCHSFIHKKFSEKELGRELNTLDKLLADETVQTFVAWARRHH